MANPESVPAQTGLGVTLSNFLRGDYARGFFARILSQTVAVIVLIEAIFLAEHFTWVFRDAVRHEADLPGIALVLACTSTEIFDLALAVAILMAAYLTLLRMRENRELLGIVDRAYVIESGRVLAEGDVAEIVADQDVRRVYLGEEFRL